MFYGLPEVKKYSILYRGQYCVIADMHSGTAVFDVKVSNNDLVVRTLRCNKATRRSDILVSVYAQTRQRWRKTCNKENWCIFTAFMTSRLCQNSTYG